MGIESNAFIAEMNEYVRHNESMFDVFGRTINIIGTLGTVVLFDESTTEVKRSFVRGHVFEDKSGIITDELLERIHDDIRMMNVSYVMDDINGHYYVINDRVMNAHDFITDMFETYLFVFLDDNDYELLLNCDSDDHFNGCGNDCGDIIMRTMMSAKRHAIMNRNSDDIVSATLIGTAAMRQ